MTTATDKRRAVEIALREFGNLSDRQIAEICAVGHGFVGRVRADQLDSKSSCEARMGADGKIRKMPIATMRHEPRGEVELPAWIGLTKRYLAGDVRAGHVAVASLSRWRRRYCGKHAGTETT